MAFTDYFCHIFSSNARSHRAHSCVWQFGHGAKGLHTWLFDGPVKSEKGERRRREQAIVFHPLARNWSSSRAKRRTRERSNGRLEAMAMVGATSLDSAARRRRRRGRSGWEKYSLLVKVNLRRRVAHKITMQMVREFGQKLSTHSLGILRMS